MTSAPEMPAIVPELVGWALALEDFREFLRYVRIARTIVRGEEAVSDGASIPFEPWPHLLERADAWQIRHDNEVVLKARQLGLSWLAAAYALWTVLRQESAKVLLISQTEGDAEELMRKTQFIYDNLTCPAWMRGRVLKRNTTELVIWHGGHILCVPSTPRGGRGFTATLVIVDEAAHHLHAVANWLAYSPAALDGGQIIILSTAAGTTGFFADRYAGAMRGVNGFTPVFIGALERPDRVGDDAGTAWLQQAREAFEGMPDEFPQEYPLRAEDAFVQLSGLVYPQASRDVHGRVWNEKLKLWLRADGEAGSTPPPWEQCIARYGAYDLGGGDPTAIGALGVYRDGAGMMRVHLYAYYWHKYGAPGISDMHQWLTEWDRPEARMVRIEADPHDAVVEASLAALGHNMRTADWSRGKGLGVLAQYLEEGWITFPADAEELWHEFASYRWLTTVDPQSRDRYATSTPYDHHGDLIDMIRYGLMGLYRDFMNRRESRVAFSDVNW